MEGVEEVKQLDDTLLHWAATVAGKKAEWDAKIIAQEPDRRIARNPSTESTPAAPLPSSKPDRRGRGFA
jgi:hypothetical protein